MNNLKVFNPDDIDESLVKLIAFGEKRFYCFPSSMPRVWHRNIDRWVMPPNTIPSGSKI